MTHRRIWSVFVYLVLALFATKVAASANVTLYVAPDGDDRWSGRLPAANTDHSDGPVASPTGARNAIRRLRSASTGSAAAVTVLFRGGTYFCTEPFVLEPQDSGTAEAPVVYTTPKGQHPVLSGGRVIRGWKSGPGGIWTVHIPEVASGQWHFRQLFVNGHRRTCAKSPNEGYFRMAGKSPLLKDAAGKDVLQDHNAFLFSPNDIKNWPDVADGNIVVFHSWETSRNPIATVDEAQRLVTLAGHAVWAFGDWEPKQRYYVENVREALDAPGEWYLDRKSGTLSYYPMPGEDMTSIKVVAPRLTRLVELRGTPDSQQFVQHVTLRGLTFSYQDWTLEPQGHSDPQASVTVPAAVMADGARQCVIENCEVSHVGDYAIWFRRGCKDCRLVHNRVYDLGVGGIRIGETVMAANDDAESSMNLIDNNHIFDGGHVYAGGVGVWVAQSSHNVISHNEIHDFFYSGMSIGWNWDDAPNRTHHNTIEYNHVHHVLKGVLSDGAAIYALGVSPGSIIRNNVFHDVWPYQTPPYGWGIYLDATASGYLVENNVVYNTLSGGLMYNNGGHEHTIRNNIFALSVNHALWPCWEKRPNSFRRNILYMTQGSLFVPLARKSLQDRIAANGPLGEWDENLYWHTGGTEQVQFFEYSLAKWQALGLDQHSQIADPRFVSAAKYDFRLKATSPAFKLGFQPIDATKVGLYGDTAWVKEARQVKHPKTIMPAPPQPPAPHEVDDDFEKTPAGSVPQDAIVDGEGMGASIRVTDEYAATGKHSLKVTDAKAVQPSWQPHLYYEPHLVQGTVRQTFDLRLTPNALVVTEWRDTLQATGPSVVFDASGRISVGGKVLTTISPDGWIHVEIEARLGKNAPKTFKLSVVPSNGAPQVFANLTMTGTGFAKLDWLGFISAAAADTTFFIDNLQIKQIRQ